MTRLRLGVRQSALAQAQAREVVEQLRASFPELSVETILIATSGDTAALSTSSKAQNKAPVHGLQSKKESQGGLKALFTKEIEEALLDNRIDLAVHSLKDMAADIPRGLMLAAVPLREDARDVWISRRGVRFKELRTGATVATGAVRRQAQLRHLRPDLELVELRGNVDTRLRKLEEAEWDGMVLALAGLKRLGRDAAATDLLSMEVMLPAIGQGALAIETRSGDAAVEKIVNAIDHSVSHQAVRAERAFLRTLGGNCQTPIAAHARVSGDRLAISGLVVDPSGEPFLHATEEGPAQDPETLGQRVAQAVLARGADKILE